MNTGTAVNFTAAGADEDGDTLTYAWDFGDGGTSTAQNPAHTYTTGGTFEAKVTVSDGKGGTATATATVIVNAPPQCGPGTGFLEDFNGTALGAGWEVVRGDSALTVGGGLLTIPTQAGDLYQTTNTAKNIVLRPAPTGPFTITAKVNHKGLVQYQQAGIIVYGDDNNYVKLDRTASNAADGGQRRVLRVHPGAERHRAQCRPRTGRRTSRPRSRRTSTCASATTAPT